MKVNSVKDMGCISSKPFIPREKSPPPRTEAQWVRVINVVDGDTVDVNMRVNNGDYCTQRVRIIGINCAERKGATKRLGDMQMLDTSRLTLEKVLWLVPNEPPGKDRDDFGRILADLQLDGITLSQWHLRNGVPPWKR